MPKTNLNTPWSLRFEQDGTEDIAVIADANGDDLLTSRPFWLPEQGDPTPATLEAVKLAVAAPRLLGAVKFILRDLNTTLDHEARLILEAARDEATGERRRDA